MNRYEMVWISLTRAQIGAGIAEEAAEAANAAASRGWRLTDTTYIPSGPVGEPGLLLTFERG